MKAKELTLLSPDEASTHLGIPDTTLEKYVQYFPNLFTGYAKREDRPRYTLEDLEIFSRITQLGDRISIRFPEPISNEISNGKENQDRAKAILSEDLASILINVSRDVDQLREILDTLMERVAISSLDDSTETIDALQEELGARLSRIEAEIGLDRPTPKEYRRSLSGMRWHWNEACPHYPTNVEHFSASTRPFGFQLCTICLGKEAD